MEPGPHSAFTASSPPCIPCQGLHISPCSTQGLLRMNCHRKHRGQTAFIAKRSRVIGTQPVKKLRSSNLHS
eukprot:1149422-Pelagomonas_calceolata.AAC.2